MRAAAKHSPRSNGRRGARRSLGTDSARAEASETSRGRASRDERKSIRDRLLKSLRTLDRTSLRTGLVVPLALVLALGLGACFEEPVREQLEVDLLGDGRTVITLTTDLTIPESSLGNTGLDRRLDQLRIDLESGSDLWADRFRDLGAEVARTTLDHRNDLLTRAQRRAVVDDPRGIERFFSDSLVLAHLEEVDGWTEVSFQPLAPGRASRRQRRMLDQGINEWTDALSRYLDAAGDLWSYLDQNPQRAEVCFRELFGEVAEGSGGSDPEDAPGPNRDEEALIETLGDAMGDALAVLVVDDAEAFSLDEISRLAYDPFPASLVLQLPARPEEVEGFIELGDNRWAVPTLSLWQALRRLEGRWLTPDPLVAYVEVARAGEDAVLDLEAFSAAPRRHQTAPRSDEIRQAIEEQLRPAPLYRALVKLPGSPAGGAEDLLDRS